MYNWKKDIAKWKVGNTLYLSVVFSWQVEEAERIMKEHKGNVIMGGPAIGEGQCEGFDPILFHNPCATFTTRGCPNKCGFCIVPKIEEDFREIKDFRPAPLICDNNFLAASYKHIDKVVQKLKRFPFVDFNQGLDCRRFDEFKAIMLGKLNCKIRFAFDSWKVESKLKDAIDLCRKYTTSNIGVYCLIGYDDTMEDAVGKLELLRSWGVLPNPMRYQPIDAKVKNEYVHENWTEEELKKVMRYYSRLNYLGHIPFGDYKSMPNQGSLFDGPI